MGNTIKYGQQLSGTRISITGIWYKRITNKSHFIVSTVIQLKHSEGKTTRIGKRIDSERCQGHGIYNRKSFCGIDSFLSNCKRGKTTSISIEQVSIMLRFF